MLDLVQAHVCERAAELSREFASALPFRHLVIDDFLEAEFCRRLIAEFPPFNAKQAINEMGAPGKKAVVSEIVSISPAYRKFDALMRHPSFLALTGRITGIADLLYDADYVGGGTHENLNGQDLDLHIDFNFHPRRPLHRRLNLIVFLNPDWSPDWGGCLNLTDAPWSAAPAGGRCVVPIANRAVIFETTEKSWHGFSRIALPAPQQHLSRRSLAVYFYTKSRPEADAQAPHGTVYIPQPMPEHLTAGHTLTAEDVHGLEVLIERRNAQIRFLYERELEMSRTISGITGSLSFRLGRLLTWLPRALGRRRSGS